MASRALLFVLMLAWATAIVAADTVFGPGGLGTRETAVAFSATTMITVAVFWRTGKTGTLAFAFYILTFLFNGAHALLLALGVDLHRLSYGAMAPAESTRTTAIVALGLHALAVGVLSLSARHPRPRLLKQELAVQPSHVRATGYALAGLSLPLLAMDLFKSVRTAIQSGYFSLYQQPSDVGIANASSLLAGVFLPGAFLVLAASRGRRSAYLAAGLIGVYATVLVIVGYRGGGMRVLVVLAWVWHYAIRRIRPRTFGLAVVFALVVIPVVRETRNIPRQAGTFADALETVFTSPAEPLTQALVEMGTSMEVVAHTVRFVPSVRDYDMGASYAYASFTVVPNLFWQIHPTVERGKPSEWLTRHVAPDIARRGGGLGFSVIAEAYWNFGLIGLPIVLFLVGILIATVERQALAAAPQLQPTRYALVATYFVFLLAWPRADAVVAFRPLAWYVLSAGLVVLFVAYGDRIRAPSPCRGCNNARSAPLESRHRSHVGSSPSP